MPLVGIEDISLAYGLNHYRLDRPLRDILRYFIGREPPLDGLGEYAGRELYELAYIVDKSSRPFHIMWSIKGERTDNVWIDPSQRRSLLDLLLVYGVNRFPYSGGTWHEHYASQYLIGDAGLNCILTITIQTAYALEKYGPDEIRSYYRNMVGLDEPVLFGATWFTEIQGGSDLGANTTVAEHVEGSIWRLNGYKYFASGVGLADIALATGRPKSAPMGAKGLALFAVPRYRDDRSLNYYTRRLKEKSGTILVPTGEVEFIDTEAYLLGEASKGIYYTLEDLMVSRLANSVAAVGIARKAYLEAYLYSKERRAFGKQLIEHKLVKRDLLEMEILIEASLALAYKAVDLFHKHRLDKPPYSRGYHYARLLTHIAKNMTAEVAAYVTKQSMELFGGIGFLREYVVERWHREALITPIWEGTSNIQALDMLEAIYRKAAHEPLLEDIESTTREAYNRERASAAYRVVEDTLKDLYRKPSEAEYKAKDILMTLAYSIATIVLENMALVLDSDRYSLVAELVYRRFIEKKPLLPPADGKLAEIISLGETL